MLKNKNLCFYLANTCSNKASEIIYWNIHDDASGKSFAISKALKHIQINCDLSVYSAYMNENKLLKNAKNGNLGKKYECERHYRNGFIIKKINVTKFANLPSSLMDDKWPTRKIKQFANDYFESCAGDLEQCLDSFIRLLLTVDDEDAYFYFETTDDDDESI